MLDANNVVVHSELVAEVTEEPTTALSLKLYLMMTETCEFWAPRFHYFLRTTITR
ncbi:hypothetical protein O9992_06245 [Vibrio lentus]|nr:hypothetical protein [Vibrio lentus]